MKILIVEDEFNAREGLAEIIKKTCPQHEICGKAADGEEGFNLAVAENPDLIFVDIGLPKMNGLELIEKLTNRKLGAAFVILSGYAEFDYAQRAIRYGVSEYLLKPITYDKLIRVIKNMEIWKQAAAARQKKRMPKSTLLCSILQNRSDAKEAMEVLKNMLPVKKLYLLNIYIGKNDPQTVKKAQIFFHSFCGIKKYKLVCSSTFLNRKLVTVLINSNENKNDVETAINYHLLFVIDKKSIPDITFSLLAVDSLSSLYGKFSLIRQINDWGLSLGNKKVITKNNIPMNIRSADDVKNGVRRINMEALSAIKSDEPKELMELNKKLIKFLTEEICPPKTFKGACAQYIFSVLACYREFNIETVEETRKLQLFEAMRGCCTQKEMLDCLNKLTSLYHIMPDKTKANSILVRKTIIYISRYYSEKISLEDIAAELKVTPEYISHLFTKDIGMSFSDYVKKYRIDMAKKIMKTSNYKIYQIGKKVGYKDPKYFNKMFKEVTGLSPKEYMKKGLLII